MTINNRGGTIKKPTPRPAPKAAAVDDTDPAEGVTNVTVSRAYTIPGDGEYESQKVQVMVSAPNYEQASALVEEYMTQEFERSTAQFAQFREASDRMAEEVGGEEDGGAEEGGEEGATEGGEAYTADEVRAMKRKELETLNEDFQLGLEPSDYAKTPKGNASFAEAIISVAGLEDDAGGETAEEGGDEGEEAGDEAGEEEGEEGGISAEEIRGMDRPALVKLCKEYQLETKPADHKKATDLAEAIIAECGLDTGDGEEAGEEAAEEGEEAGEEAEEEPTLSAQDVRDLAEAGDRKSLIALNNGNELGIKSKNMSEDEFAEAIIEAMGLEDGGEEAGEEGEEAGDGEEAADPDDQGTGYTRKELEAMPLNELKAVYDAWGIKDKFPTGAKPVALKTAVNRIIRYQETGK